MPTQTISLHGNHYTITQSGTGEQSILIVGIGTLLNRTLSSNFRNHFMIYSSDLYWDGDNTVADMSMDTLANDIVLLNNELKLKRPILMAHSAYGPLAIHTVKLFPDVFSGVIMIGSPPGWNQDIITKNQAFFEADADEARKKVDLEQKSQFTQTDFSSMNPYEQFLTLYADYDRARYWYNPHYDSRPLWEGLFVNMPVFSRYFDDILPCYDVTHNMACVVCPVFLAAGRYDYDCCPKQRWQELTHKPKDLTIAEFNKSGHYPNYEQPELFDQRVTQWYETKVKS